MNSYRLTRSPAYRRGDWFRIQQNGDTRAAEKRRQHFIEDGERDRRLMGERHGRVAEAEIPAMPGRIRHRVVAAIVVANAIAIVPIGSRAAIGLDVGVFVERHGLLGDLPSDPVGLFGENDTEAVAGRGEGCRDAAHPAADDGNVGLGFSAARSRGDSASGQRERFKQ